MKKVITAIIVILCSAAFSSADESKIFKKLHNLEGTWKMNGKRGPVYEAWIKVNDDYLQSTAYVVKGNDTIINERVALRNTESGIFYTPTVENQNNGQPIPFKMTKAEDNSFTFENPEHDFPKRIVYRFVTADSLHAFVDDGTDAGKKINFYYKRQ